MSCTSDIVYRLYLQFFVGGRNVLFTLFVFASYSGVQHILICDFCFVCLRLMYSGVQHIVCCILCYVCLRLMYGGIQHILCCGFFLSSTYVWWYPPHIMLCFCFVCLRLVSGVWWCPTHIVLCFCFVCLRLVSGVWWYPPHIVLCFCFVCLRLVSGVWWYPPHIVLCFCFVCLRLVSGVWWYPPHIVLCFCFVCLRLVSGVWWCPTHIVLCFLFCLSSLYVLCTQCCQFLCIVHCPLGLSNICIHSTYLRLITIPPSNILRIAIEISFENHHEGCNSSNFKVDEHS